MSDLFQRDKSTISKHIKHIFDEGELVQYSVVANFATTAADGKTYQVDYYNLDVVISVGSKPTTKFSLNAAASSKKMSIVFANCGLSLVAEIM